MARFLIQEDYLIVGALYQPSHCNRKALQDWCRYIVQAALRSTKSVTHAQLGENPELRNMFFRIARFSTLPVVLIVVFDGPERPGQKRNHQAPGEAEAELAWLNKQGHIDAVLTDDSDALVPHIKNDHDTVATYRASDIALQAKTPILADGMLLFAVLRGGDYDRGLLGCGEAMSYALTNTDLGTKLRFAAEEFQSHADFQSYLRLQWVPELKHQLAYDPHGFIGKKHAALAHRIPDSFPAIRTVLQYFISALGLDLIIEPDLRSIALLSHQLFSWSQNNMLTTFKTRVWPGICARGLLNGLVQHPMECINVQLEPKMLCRIKFDVTDLSDTVCSAVQVTGNPPNAQHTTISLWLSPAVIPTHHLHGLLGDLRQKYASPKANLAKQRKRQMIDTICDEYPISSGVMAAFGGQSESDESDDSYGTSASGSLSIIDLTLSDSEDDDGTTVLDSPSVIDLTLSYDENRSNNLFRHLLCLHCCVLYPFLLDALQMPKAKKNNDSKAAKAPKTVKRKKTEKTADPKKEQKSHKEHSKEIRDDIKKHGKADQTNKAYDGQVERAREYVKQYAEEQANLEAQWKEKEKEHRQAIGEDIEDLPRELFDSELPPEFASCLTGPPVECTPAGIVVFMHWKCFEQNKGGSTAEQINAAFLRYYDLMDGNKYHQSRRFQKDESTGQWVGNPCRSAEVEEARKACKNKDGEAERRHTCPWLMGDSKQFYAWSRTQCPHDAQVTDSKTLAIITQHLYFRAYYQLAFTVWTRNVETSSLQAKHFQFNDDHPAEPGGGVRVHPFFRLNLSGRKGWQNKMSKNEHQLNGHMYNIYDSSSTPEVDAYTSVLEWINHLVTHILRRPLQPDDYIFPAFNSTWTSLRLKECCDSKAIHTLINTMAVGAGINGAGSFTTHCFRRGGAQYRFMYAPLGERWSLTRIRWWGGWAEGEHRDTLIRYLLDELYTYEEDHSDALNPVKMPTSPSPPSSLNQTLITLVTSVAASVQSLQQSMVQLQSQWIQPPPSLALQSDAPTFSSPLSSFPNQPLQSTQTANPNVSFWLLGTMAPAHHLGPVTSTHLQAALTVQNPSVFLADAPCMPIIPGIDQRAGENGWKQLVRDWETADPERGLLIPLKDWPKEWYEGVSRKALYGQREIITKEFIERYDRNETKFLEAYPEHCKGIGALLKAVRQKLQSEGLRCTRQRKSN
ncbi:hypothetical protein D9758_018155 [Tetrapyrgos nigripes]|uniref:XPG-I domain-containing protein n=1 Tax=Tetrapyrgos nigripes TaxID=182062 RepID=A0A8H5C2R1_9AGAR|nr:hypothetical protein D9758_018155 [Tetrapyrgos nigripes]